MDERNAAIAKRRRQAAKAKQKETMAAARAAAAAPPKAHGEDMSFAALAGDEPLPKVSPKAPVEAEPTEDEAEVDKEKEAVEKKRDPFDVSGKLDLGPVDENRPLLTGNAYKPTSKWRYAPVAAILFAVLWYVYTHVPSLQLVVVVGTLVGGLAFGIWSYRIHKAKSETYRPEKH